MKPKKYRPACGTEGADFRCEFCDQCFHDRNDDCETLTLTLIFDVNEEQYPNEWIIGKNGPQCTAFKKDDDVKNNYSTIAS